MIDFLKLPSPCYVLDEELLDRNLATVDRVRRESGAEIIVALKACAMWSIFPELAKHSDGATASSAAEARLVFEEFGRPAHTYAPVYTDSNIDEILNCSDHITFNSLSQFRRFGQKALINGISCGLRINPQYSPVETDLYNPCVPGSRLGVTAEQLAAHGGLPAGVEGLHFHVLCESRPEHLQKALEAVETHFGAYLDRIKWLNMGGGHLMTVPYVIEFNADMAREGAKHSNDAAKKYQKMARIVGLPAPTPKVGVANLIAEIQRLLKYMDRPQCMSECGVSVEEFNKHREEIVRRALADACTQANPRKVTAEDINKILDHIAK